MKKFLTFKETGLQCARWYKDRDFPEVKAGNDDIVAVIEDQKQLKRIIDDHNSLADEIFQLREAFFEAKYILSNHKQFKGSPWIEDEIIKWVEKYKDDV